MDGLSITDQVFPIDFLIETEQGYRNLVRLLTSFYSQGSGERRPLKRDDIRERTGGLVIIIPLDGELTELIYQRDRQKTERFLKQAIELFGAGLVIGVDNSTPEDAAVMAVVSRLARFVGLRVLAAPPVFYPDPGDAAAATYLENPGQAPNRSFAPPEDPKALPALWPEDEVLSRWVDDREEVPHEAGNIARRCTWRPARIRRVFPVQDFERGFDPNSYLFDLVIRGATMRYGEITESLKQRINREFEDIKAQNLAPYVLLSHQINQALDERSISRGMGRGRIVCSVVAYCLGITRIDPLKYNLVSKPLLGEGEVVPPLQVEVPASGVKPLLAWLRETYGDEYMAEIGRIQELRRDQMINDLATWAGMTPEERRLTFREKARLRSTGAAARLDELTESARSRRWRDPAFLGDIAARLSPRPKGWVSTGDRWVLCAEPLECVVPRIASVQGRPVTGIEEEAIDTLGMARIVLVPHQLLDMLDQTMRLARALNPSLEFHAIPLDDKATFELLSRGDTAGIPPLENVTMRCLLRKHQPGNLLQLLRIKTEAGQTSPDERRELSEELPDVLLSYQLAYLKANYPLAFYAAAIGAMIEQHSSPAALIRAARRERFEVHPPDINLSEWGTTIQAGEIRLGMAAVRNFGQKAWDNVQSVRSGGNFTSIENFCERVNMRVVNLKVLRMLIASGAMDSLEQNRASMDAVVTQLQRRMRERQEEAGAEKLQGELFDLEHWGEGSEAEPAEKAAIQEWNHWERLQREYEALGFYLAIDPLRRYKIVLDHLKPMQIEHLSGKMTGKSLRVVGLTGVHESEGPLITQPGSVLLDLEGIPVFLSPPLARICGYCLEPGTEVLVTGRLMREQGFACLMAEGLWRLSDLEEQATKVASLTLHLARENKATLRLLIALARQFPGNTDVKLADYPGRHGWTYGRLARQKVFFCSPLYHGLCKILPMEAIELFNQNGELLAIKGVPQRQEPPAEVDD
jgi:DNA polymerase III alpha subunit